MRVSKIELHDFRQFAEFHLPLATRLNVLVGINGAGKTSVLDATAKLLSWSIRRLISPMGGGGGAPLNERDIRNGVPGASISLEAQWEQQPVAWTLTKSRRGSASWESKNNLKALTEFARDLLGSERVWKLPLLVGYTVNRAVLDVPLRIKTHHAFAPHEAYEHAFDGTPNFRTFFEWFRENEDLENERKVDAMEHGLEPGPANPALTAVTGALEAFLPGFRHWRIRRSPLRMEVRKGTEILDIRQLSDGEKNLMAMVGDLARRMAMLYYGKDGNALAGRGVVLIDEVELHLHPAWQRCVLPRLLATFPNLQFIVTTHSPLVLAQLNALLYRQHVSGRPGTKEIDVFSLEDGHVSSMLDPDTGLLVAGEMDTIANAVDAEFDRLLEGERP